MTDERARMHANLDRRQNFLMEIFASVRKDIDAGRYDNTHACREWLERFAVGVGLNICAGEFSIGNAIGVNNDARALATDHWAFADRFAADMEPLDYIVTNYLECFPDPLRVLQDWRMRMRVGGVIAIVTRNADLYVDGDMRGPLENHRRFSCFTMGTLCFYLERAGFTVYTRETFEKEIRVAARRR